MKIYPLKSLKGYYVTDTVYRRAYYLVRDYHRLQEVIEIHEAKIENGSNQALSITGECRSSNISNKVESQVTDEVYNNAVLDLEIINEASLMIPTEYRKAILNKIQKKTPWPDYAHSNTFSKWQQKFIYYIAYKKGWM